MSRLPWRYRLAVRILDLAFQAAKRIDPEVISVHAVRTSKPNWAAGMSVVTDPCIPPGKAYIGPPGLLNSVCKVTIHPVDRGS